MGDYKIKDITLADKGELLIEWASDHMPVLSQIRERFSREKPLDNVKIGACLHATKETAVLVRALEAGGAQVSLCGSNPLSTQDEVVAALAENGTNVYAWRGQTTEEYYWCINKVLECRPALTMDDGADLVSTIHSKRTDLLTNIKGGSEETTTGVIRLRAMAVEKALKYPIVAVNDAYTKHLFDNRYGTGQSTIDGILRATSVLLAGKRFVVCGYGWVGRGIAIRAKGMGADVIVTEVNPLRALEAVMDGFRVMPIKEASKVGDIFVTATGNINVISGEHIRLMKNGTILANSGHFNVEINIPALEKMANSKKLVRDNMEEYKLRDGRSIYLLAEGRLVNLAAAEGHPSEVMDLSFADQALVAEYLWKSERLEPQVYRVPEEIDSMVAALKLKSMGVEIDNLTEEQEKYIKSWREGTT
ncbi:adenosylhomocysteinase [Candidatus Bathyarchaeota archaeon]|nr:adenosylhomocysteinase [Candidatus Bathyarchaeota archaeon]MBS7630824.1 adenosylhomocysteinase [Candidatus Bathyarchaeota archaeon]